MRAEDCPFGKLWTPEEDAVLRECYAHGIKACEAQLPGRSLVAIRERIWRQGLQVPRRPVWSFGAVAEELFMAGLNGAEIAPLIGRPKTQVISYVSYHGLREVRAWRRQYEVDEILGRYGYEVADAG